MRIFNNNNLIADIFFYFDFVLNNFNVLEYVYIKGNIFNNNIHTIEITSDDNIEKNIRFYFTYVDFDNNYLYANEYFTYGYEMFIIYKCEHNDAPSLPLIEKTIKYRYNGLVR